MNNSKGNAIAQKEHFQNKRAEDTEYIDFLITQYQVLAERRINHNSLLWSIPPLLFVAQTVLWGIAFKSSTDPIVRIAISLFSAFVGIASLQCFLRNRLMEIADTEQSYIIEHMFKEMYGANKDYPIPPLIINNKLRKRTWFEDGTVSASGIGTEKTLKEFLNVRFKNPIYRVHSSAMWKWVFIISIILPILNVIYMVIH